MSKVDWPLIAALLIEYAGERDGTNAWRALPQAVRGEVEQAVSRLPAGYDEWALLAFAQEHDFSRSQPDEDRGICRCGALIEELDDGNGFTYWAHVKRMRMEFDHAAIPATG